MDSFINDAYISDILSNVISHAGRIDEVLDKAAQAKGLDLHETAVLLAPLTDEQERRLFDTALKVKQNIYGNRMVLFAPLYVSNECANRCAYCAFSVSNKELVRRTLNADELANEVRILQDMGHKRVLAVYGEHPKWDAHAIAESVRVIYSAGDIRRVNVNCAPLDVEGFRKLHGAGIGTYQCFQESYNHKCYESVHLGGKKKDFSWRLFAMHRAQEAGLDDVGLGVLFGLFDFRFEVLGLVAHALELEKKYGVGPHTISVPRIEPAQNSPLSENPPNVVTDKVFKRIVAVLRLAMPYTGIILSTRENQKLRSELLGLGVSQLSAASRTYPGGYADIAANKPTAQQFWVGDERSLDQVIRDLVDDGFIPSFCTGCYRHGRTGDNFMGLAKTSFIKDFCTPNAITSFAEYLYDYAPADLRRDGLMLIEKEIVKNIKKTTQRERLEKSLKEIADGKRDVYC